LRHGSVNGVNQQQHAVYHRHYTLYLTTKVSVTRGIYNVYVVTVPVNSGVFGQNGNTTLFLLIVGVHDSLNIPTTGVQRAGEVQQFINQSSLAMVNVGDNGDVADFFNHGKEPVNKKIAATLGRRWIMQITNKNGGRVYNGLWRLVSQLFMTNHRTKKAHLKTS
jgi:hypothetical protein